MLNTSSRSSAKAVVLKEFIPILDTLQELRAKYGADDFGKQFDALYGTMKTAFASMGVNEFHAQVGDVVDMARMNVVEQVYSSAVPKGAVVDVVSNNHCGMELDGNCMRMVKVVASLGPEPATAVAAKDDGEEMPEEATEM
jgi:molecular chaperone GrpE (heat shock protein)